MDSIKRQLLGLFCVAAKGKRFWHSFAKKYLGQNELAILIPDESEDVYFCAFFYLNDLLIQRGKRAAVFLVRDLKMAQKYRTQYSQNVKDVFVLDDVVCRNLITYYRLMNFDSRFLVASFQEPFGRHGERIVHRYPERLHELFALCVYAIRPYSDCYSAYLKGEQK